MALIPLIQDVLSKSSLQFQVRGRLKGLCDRLGWDRTKHFEVSRQGPSALSRTPEFQDMKIDKGIGIKNSAILYLVRLHTDRASIRDRGTIVKPALYEDFQMQIYLHVMMGVDMHFLLKFGICWLVRPTVLNSEG